MASCDKARKLDYSIGTRVSELMKQLSQMNSPRFP